MSDRNLSKTIHAFFSVDETAPMEVAVLQGLASRAARCATVCRVMRPYKAALYGALRRTAHNGHSMVTLGPEARVDIWMWRTFLCLINFDTQRIARPLLSFEDETPTWVVSFDASLEGYGVGLSTVPRPGQDNVWETLVAYTTVVPPYDLKGDSSYQNHSEFTAVILGMMLMEKCGAAGGSYVLKGDSMSALRWAREDRADSMICRRASICFSLLSIHLDMSVAETVHVPGVENIICDGLSRGKSGAALGLPVEKYIDLESDDRVMRYLRECDPMTAMGDEMEHVEWLQHLLDILRPP